RFRQEARVASSLNQPNILTIYEFGEVDDLTFIAAEFVDGDTLRDYIRNKRLKLGEILDISIQMLAALDAAHEASIVHRDMKPENVMIRRRDHVVKVLDFGLAKVTEKKRGSDAVTAEQMVREFKTAPGLIMGTVNYMSPEQALAKTVDARSDIWSSGIIIYEMVTGTTPFRGSTSAHTIVRILEKQPAPLAHAAAVGVPQELQRIVDKSIAKDPDERYQSAKDMLIDLRNLKRRLDLDADIERSSAAVTVEYAQPARTAEPVVTETSKKNYAVVVALIAIVASLAAIVAVNAWRNTRNQSVVPPSTPVVTTPARTLTYWITVQKFKDGKAYQEPFDISGEINFEADYQIRLSVRSPQPGYLYILNEGPAKATTAPEYVVVFPSSTANNGSEYISANQRIQIPDQSWLKFDKEQGVEKLWLVFGENPLPELEGIKAFANRQTRGLITDAQLNKAINSYLTVHSANKVSHEKGDTLTTLTGSEKVLVYPIKLEHH
ncbi:MAG TPA: protein kinase, partial [Blastocatellia bacterium]|nr:protein kinase [Blastocatellia bacterium]